MPPMREGPSILIAALLAFVPLLAGCAPRGPASAPVPAAGPEVRVIVAGAQAQRAGEAAVIAGSVMAGTLGKLDAADPGSDLSRLNRVAAAARLQVSRDVLRFLDLARHYSALSGGFFDLTVAPLERLWGLQDVPAESPMLPEVVEAIRSHVDSRALQISDQGSVAFTTPHIQVRAGLLGDAYAMDLAVVELRRRGFGNSLLRSPHAARALGDEGPDGPWRVEIPDPAAPERAAGSVALADPFPALAVLRARARTIQAEGRTWAGFINPRTGYPVEGTALAAVLGPTVIMAHALAEALLAAGPEGAPTLLAAFPRCEVLLISEGAEPALWLTPGFRERFTPAHTLPVHELAPAAEAPAS